MLSDETALERRPADTTVSISRVCAGRDGLVQRWGRRPMRLWPGHEFCSSVAKVVARYAFSTKQTGSVLSHQLSRNQPERKIACIAFSLGLKLTISTTLT